MSLKRGLVFILAIFFLFGCYSIENAHALTPSEILVDVSPPNPAPNENVTISLSSFAGNLNIAKITWVASGRTVLTGTGQKIYSFTAGNAGTQTTIGIKVSLNGEEAETSVVIKPSTMVMLWQATDSYVPPFYKGKAMPSLDSEVRVVALPEIRSVGVKNLNYSWKLDYSNEQAASGYGKNSFTYNNDFLESANTVSVTVETTDGSNKAEGSLVVAAANPKILFYKRDPKLGTIWEKIIPDNYKLTGDETFEAAPYFIAPKNINTPTLSWNWTINDSPVILNGFIKNLIPMKIQQGTSGSAKLNLNISNQYKVFQETSKEINIQY